MDPNSTDAVEPQSIDRNDQVKVEHKTVIVWFNVFLISFLHVSCLYGIYLAVTSASSNTSTFAYIYATIGGLGVTAGAHRLWTHRSYKAKWPLKALLMVLSSIPAQNDLFVWCRDHRVHHKFTETDADPHNIKRGFFFAHMGWLMCRKHPAVTEEGKKVHLDDLLADPFVRFHKRFYYQMTGLFCILLPTIIPVWLWGETMWNAFFIAAMARYCISLHFAWLVNSAAHCIGDQPFDKYIKATENPVVSFLAIGEGWHNYHHVFPWDYATSELGYTLNLTKIFIDFMAFFGLAYDLKSAHPKLVKSSKLNKGDGTRMKEVQATGDGM